MIGSKREVADEYPLRPYKKGASEEQQKIIDFAWEKTKDPTFVYLLEAENGLWSVNRKSMDCSQGCDWGLCQVNELWHPDIVSDPKFCKNSQDPHDMNCAEFQITTCYNLFKNGTTFYGMNNIETSKLNFEWK